MARECGIYVDRIDAHAGEGYLFDPSTGKEVLICRQGWHWLVSDGEVQVRMRKRDRAQEVAELWLDRGVRPVERIQVGACAAL